MNISNRQPGVLYDTSRCDFQRSPLYGGHWVRGFLKCGVIGRIVECPDGASWCKVEIDGFEGWLRRVEFWGVYADEVLR